MGLELRKMLAASWMRAATLSALWGAILGAASLIINAIPTNLVIAIVLIITIPLSLVVPILIGFIVTRKYAAKASIQLLPAAVNGAISGIIYAIVIIAIALFFILVNYGISAMLWGMSEGMGLAMEIMGESLLVILATVILGLPILGIIGIIGGAIGGAVYSVLKK